MQQQLHTNRAQQVFVDQHAETLTYAGLNSAINRLREQSDASDGQPSWIERSAFGVGVGAAGLAIALQWLLPKPYGSHALSLGLLIEIAGFSVGLALLVKRNWRTFRHARIDMAESMDRDYANYDACVEHLRLFPTQQRARLYRYVDTRSNRILSNTRLLTGGLERFAIVPLLIALYLQFKDWHWDNWVAVTEIGYVQGLIIFFLMIIFLASCHLLFIQARVKAIADLLAEANTRDQQEGLRNQPSNYQTRCQVIAGPACEKHTVGSPTPSVPQTA